MFWKLLARVPALEVLAHRAVWGALSFLLLLASRRDLKALWPALRQRKILGAMALASVLIGINWLTYIHAVAADWILECSLGYFINPLASVLLAAFVLGEKLRRLQWMAVGLAAFGVVQLAAQAQGLPWVSLILALSFALYALVRKVAPVAALLGSTMEALLLLPWALAYLLFLAWRGGAHFGEDASISALLVSTGLVTALPLLLFALSARLLPLSIVGFMQYLAPTLQFLLAVFVYGERFSPAHRNAFVCIWVALAIFSLEGWWRSRKRARATAG